MILTRLFFSFDQVRARLIQRECSSKKWDSLEERFGATVTTLQQEFPPAQAVKRIRLMRIMERFSGDVEEVRKFLQKVQERHGHEGHHSHEGRHQAREELKTKYATQLAELASAGVNVNSPCILRQLEKNQGDVNKVIEITTRRKERMEKFADTEAKYANQIAQLEADGVEIKNKRILGRLLAKADGQVDVVKQLINERKVHHEQRKEYRHKHHHGHHRRGKSSGNTTEEDGATGSPCRKRRELSADELENLKKLRAAGIRGNPKRILEIFHQCNESVELTKARTEEKREQRIRERDERILVRISHSSSGYSSNRFFSFQKRRLLTEASDSYLALNKREDWPADVEQVYLDGNNMMFVVNSLRRLCLNRNGHKTERALGEIASAWNDKMRVPNVELIFDSTRQVEQIGTVKVSSAQPKYRTTDDMLVEIARRPENQGKNKRTIVITSDRALAALVSSFNLFFSEAFIKIFHSSYNVRGVSSLNRTIGSLIVLWS